jgi:DNA replication protein DnaC
MNQTTLSKMKEMYLMGMHSTFKTAIETGSFDQFTIDQFVSQLIQSEWDDRQNRKIERNVKQAGFRYKASIEKVDFSEERSLERNTILRLAQGDYINQAQDVLITGSTGVGKSFLATALAYQACIDGYRVKYYNTTRLFAQLKIAKNDGSYLKELAKIERFNLIVLDDFGLYPMDQQNRMAFLEIIEDRHGKGAMILTSQLPVSKWYEVIGEKTIADATMDRLVHNAHRVEITGESMRKKRINQDR